MAKKLIIFFLLIIFPFGQLVRYDLGNSVVLHVNDLVVGVIFVLNLFKLKRHPLLKPVGLVVFTMVLSLVLNINHYSVSQTIISALYLFRWVAYASLFFFFVDFKDKKLIKNGLLWAVVAVAVLGLIQYLLIPNVSFLAAANWDNHYFRLVSTFLDPGFTGAILTLGLFSSFNPIIFTALALTYSRAAYLMYFIGFGLLAWYKRSLRLFVATTLILLVAVAILPKTFGEGTKLDREASIFSRVESWQVAIHLWQKAPVFGIGFDTYRYATNNNAVSHSGAGSDSSLLHILATTGIVGLVAYLYLLKNLWFAGKTLFKVSLAAVLINSWFNNGLLYPWLMEYLWLLLVFDS